MAKNKSKSWGYDHGYGVFPHVDMLLAYFFVFLTGITVGAVFCYAKISETKIALTTKNKKQIIVGSPSGFSSPAIHIDQISNETR
jgi:hypothetical protein